LLLKASDLFEGETPRGRTGGGWAGLGRYPECATGKAHCPGLSAGWAGASTHREHGFAQGMRESVLVTDRNRFYHGGQLHLQNETKQGRVGQQHQLPPRVPPPPWELLVGGDAWGLGGPGGRGTAGGGGISCAVLAYLAHLLLTWLLSGVNRLLLERSAGVNTVVRPIRTFSV
jgi:hypothetical protein